MKLNFLIPKQPIFFGLFVKQSQEVLAIAKLLDKLCLTNNPQGLNELSAQAKEIEHRADDRTHEIIHRLNRTFVTPFDREDIYHLTEGLDDIVDLIENVIHNIEIYKINPQEKFITEFSQIISKDAEKLAKLTELLKMQKYTASFKELIVTIHSLEDKGDEIFIKVITKIFENGRDPVSIIKLKDIAEDLENVIDKFQAISNTFENILVKSQ
jgi:predicted phosphate transport protein (TIGR00153 family)